MKKGLLIYRINRDDSANFGVIKKCKAQQKAFIQKGMKVDMLWLCKDGVLLNDTLIERHEIPPHSLKVYLFYFFQFGIILKKLITKSDYDFVYLRHPFFDPLLVWSLRQVKKANPKIKILLEINTYPYDAEPKRILHRLSLKMDQYYRKKAKEYIDRIVDYGERKEIWGIPTILVRNGIDLEDIPQSTSEPEEGKIRLIAVGNWSYWHGLDRLIRGFEDYYKKEQDHILSLTIVGEGPETAALKKLVDQKELKQFIRFLPSTKGKELDLLFEKADAGIGTLGLHRKNVAIDSSLKHREYCVRGIPFVLSSPDLDFPKELPFIYYFPKEDTGISLNEIIDWYAKNLKTEAREYAEAKLSWKKQMRAIFDWIES